MENPKACGTACQFIQPDYPALEARVLAEQRTLRPWQHEGAATTQSRTATPQLRRSCHLVAATAE